jgi:hypothetical protein
MDKKEKKKRYKRRIDGQKEKCVRERKTGSRSWLTI